MSEIERYEEFVEYFKEKARLGIPYGLSDLYEKARELGLPIPKFDENFQFKGWLNKDGTEAKGLSPLTNLKIERGEKPK